MAWREPVAMAWTYILLRRTVMVLGLVGDARLRFVGGERVPCLS